MKNKKVVRKYEEDARTYVYYKNTFHNVSYSWLDLYVIEKNVVEFLKTSKNKGSTELYLNTTELSISVGEIEIKRGLLKGDALSRLWFCLAFRPLTIIANQYLKGYQLGTK